MRPLSLCLAGGWRLHLEIGACGEVVLILTCPICGARDSREFTYRGSASLIARPDAQAGAGAFHAYVHMRDNPAGENDELWQHALGCGAWLKVRRNTVSHEISSVELAQEVAR